MRFCAYTDIIKNMKGNIVASKLVEQGTDRMEGVFCVF